MKKLLQRGMSTMMFIALFAVGAVAAPLGVASVGAQAGFDPGNQGSCNLDDGISGGFQCTGGDTNSDTDLSGIVQFVVNILLTLIGIISVIMLIIGGIRYAISGGDSGAVTSAKNTILYAVIGLVVALLAFVIVNFVITQIGTL